MVIAMQIEIPYNWQPRPYQLDVWKQLEQGKRYAALIMHRRAGKDALSLNFMATQALQKPANYWMLLPQYKQARSSIWDAVNPHTGVRVIDQVFPPFIRKNGHKANKGLNNQEMKIELINGSIFQLKGSWPFSLIFRILGLLLF